MCSLRATDRLLSNPGDYRKIATFLLIVFHTWMQSKTKTDARCATGEACFVECNNLAHLPESPSQLPKWVGSERINPSKLFVFMFEYTSLEGEYYASRVRNWITSPPFQFLADGIRGTRFYKISWRFKFYVTVCHRLKMHPGSSYA